MKVETMKDLRVYQASTLLFKLFLLLWNRFRVRGVEHVPNQGGVLMASNHVSFLDGHVACGVIPHVF